MKLWALMVFFLLSHKVMAASECEIRLYSIDDLDTVLTQKRVYAHDGEMKSEFIKLYEEDSLNQIVMKVFQVGWPGEELMALEIFRERNNNSLESISDQSQIKGEDRKFFWFDTYKVDYDCSLI